MSAIPEDTDSTTAEPVRAGEVFRRILFKERCKLRRAWPLLALVNAAALGYLFVETRHLFRMDHAEVVWYRTIELGHIFYEALRYLPTAGGALLAVAQFLPEMRDERLRLSLHLPAPAHTVVLSHLLVGSLLLAALLALPAAGLAALTALYFPGEIVRLALMTAAPWFLAGWCAYLGAALALLEPSLVLRVFNLALTVGFLTPLLARAAPGAFATAFPWLLGLPVLLLGAALFPAYHFRQRKVDV